MNRFHDMLDPGMRALSITWEEAETLFPFSSVMWEVQNGSEWVDNRTAGLIRINHKLAMCVIVPLIGNTPLDMKWALWRDRGETDRKWLFPNTPATQDQWPR